MRLYGETAGPLIHRAMAEIQNKDFCVATGLRLPEISISRSCLSQGRVFRLAGGDYSLLVTPDGEREISALGYQDIVCYLPNRHMREGQQHCFVDDPLTDILDFASLI